MTKTIYTGGQGITYATLDEALAAVEVHEITRREYEEKFDCIAPAGGMFLDDGEILDYMVDGNGEGGYTVSSKHHSEYIDKQNGRWILSTDYWEIAEEEWDEEDDEIVSSKVLGYRKNVYCG